MTGVAGEVDSHYNVYAPAQGFIPYVTVRDLDQMTINPGHPPD